MSKKTHEDLLQMKVPGDKDTTLEDFLSDCKLHQDELIEDYNSVGWQRIQSDTQS